MGAARVDGTVSWWARFYRGVAVGESFVKSLAGEFRGESCWRVSWRVSSKYLNFEARSARASSEALGFEAWLRGNLGERYIRNESYRG